MDNRRGKFLPEPSFIFPLISVISLNMNINYTSIVDSCELKFHNTPHYKNYLM
jgi:hypothetical protein